MKNENKQRASKIKLIAFDVDGVLTDGSISYTDNGAEIKTFNAKDGQGINMLASAGFLTAIITARTSPIVERRAEDLNINHVYQGSKSKIMSLIEMMEKYNLDFNEIAYIGDDFPDICILKRAGLACCPQDAIDEIKDTCHLVSQKDGGRGAVREIADFILKNTKQGEDFLEQMGQQSTHNINMGDSSVLQQGSLQ